MGVGPAMAIGARSIFGPVHLGKPVCQQQTEQPAAALIIVAQPQATALDRCAERGSEVSARPNYRLFRREAEYHPREPEARRDREGTSGIGTSSFAREAASWRRPRGCRPTPGGGGQNPRGGSPTRTEMRLGRLLVKKCADHPLDDHAAFAGVAARAASSRGTTARLPPSRSSSSRREPSSPANRPSSWRSWATGKRMSRVVSPGW